MHLYSNTPFVCFCHFSDETFQQNMQRPSLKRRIYIAMEPRRLQSITGKPENTALEPVKPTYHQTIEPILEAETGVHGCIRHEVLMFTVNQS